MLDRKDFEQDDGDLKLRTLINSKLSSPGLKWEKPQLLFQNSLDVMRRNQENILSKSRSVDGIT